jgi:hypothetical protein
MNRASNAFSVLQATAAIVTMAIILWSLGLPSFRFAEAANVTGYSDTLSDSAPSVASNHTISFRTPTGVASGQTVVLTFDPAAQSFDLTGIGQEDVDLLENGVAESVGTNWLVSVNTTADTITLTSQGAGGVIAAGATTTVLVGLHATNDGSPDTQIDNPATPASYEIGVTAGPSDSGTTEVAIVSTVNVTASVDTLFTFSVTGTAAGTSVNGAHTTGGATTATNIPFGEIAPNTPSTTAQLLTVVTNAKSGFVVTVTADGQLDSSTGADIDGFRNGNYDTTPVSWESPAETLGDEDTYGHWGLTSDDNVLTSGLTDIYQTGLYVSASTTPVEVFRHNGPSNGSGMGVGTTTVGYRIERSDLQEAAEDYQAVLTYVATPVF